MNPQSAIRPVGCPHGRNPQCSSKPVIGVVGGVGSGKSTVAAEFEKLGCVRVDADAIGHEVLQYRRVREWLRDRWGDEVFRNDGSADRDEIARRVFDDPESLDAMNSMMHPLIRSLAEERIGRATEEPAVRGVVLDAPLLLEAGWDDMCTCLVFVEAPEEVRRRRVREARGWDEREWRMREKRQFSLDSKRSRCEYSLDNSSNVSHLRKQIRTLFDKITHAADRPR